MRRDADVGWAKSKEVAMSEAGDGANAPANGWYGEVDWGERKAEGGAEDVEDWGWKG